MIELVVARCSENTNWLRRVPRTVCVTLYDKGGGAAANALPNVGREAHTYLHHIVSRFDSLAEVTVFAQGRPFDHVSDFHRVLRDLAAGRRRAGGFDWLGFIIDWDDAQGGRLFHNWSKNPGRLPLPMAEFHRALWDGPVPDRFVFFPGAHFIATREQIRGRPRSFYARALELSTRLPDAAHCFERCWDRVFGVDGIPADFRGATLPVYLKPIRRLLEAAAAVG